MWDEHLRLVVRKRDGVRQPGRAFARAVSPNSLLPTRGRWARIGDPVAAMAAASSEAVRAFAVAVVREHAGSCGCYSTPFGCTWEREGRCGL